MKFIISLIILLSPVTLFAQPQKQVELFNLSDVELLDSPFLQAQQVDLKYILEMEPDRLLAPYLREAGLTPKAQSYTNWENTGLDGHIGGHYLSALSMMYAATGNAEVKRRLDYMINELWQCQKQVRTGFIGGTPGSINLWKEIKQGNIRAGGFDLNGKWVPLYNIHKTYAGLRDAYIFAHNEIAFEMLVKLTDWMIDVTADLSDTQMQDMLRSEHGGLNEVFADVYDLTGESKYLDLAKRFSHLAILNPLLENEDKLTGLHANTQIPKVIGYKRIADLEGNKAWNDASRFFWQTVTQNRSVSIGGNSVREHFHATDNFEPMIDDIEGPETCNTYNMLRLSNMFYQTTMDTQFIDYYERALYNHILASQEPEKGGFVYFTPMRPGHYRVYSQPQTSMWCCVGSGLENHTKYGELIYAHQEDALLVNLFIPSRVNWQDKGVVLVQETRFPDENKISFRMEQADDEQFTLRVRYPEWAGDFQQIEVNINGQKVSDPGLYMGYLSIDRKWKEGDEVVVTLPMKLEMEQLPDKRNYYSFRYGPIVLATKTGTESMTGLYADDSRGGHIAHGAKIPLDKAPTIISETQNILANFKKSDIGNLSFAYTGEAYPAKSLEFIPFFRLHNSRYAVYIHQVTAQEWVQKKAEIEAKEKQAAQLAARTVDIVYPGEQQPESDHFIEQEASTTGIHKNRHFRSARGWFSYEMKITKGAKIQFVMQNNELEYEPRLSVNGQKLARVYKDTPIEEGFVIREMALPTGLSDGKYRIRFEAGDTGNTGKIFEVRIIK
ncbi:glycosyl hydrolase [Bacteroides sp. 519]|nr:glycoside hydrolase family 127 protein [Bacteroides sp. 519]NDV60447.1 glycosyl hydrolase [Bacteroides sp. 519]